MAESIDPHDPADARSVGQTPTKECASYSKRSSRFAKKAELPEYVRFDAHPRQKRRTRRQELLLAIARASNAPTVALSSLKQRDVAGFSAALRAKLLDRASGFWRRFLRALVSNVTLTQRKVLISGPKSALGAAAKPYVAGTPNLVPSYVPDWLPETGSNRRPSD